MRKNETVAPLEKKEGTEYRIKLSYVGYTLSQTTDLDVLWKDLIQTEHHRQIVLIWEDARRLWRHYAAISVYWSILVLPPFQCGMVSKPENESKCE